MMPASHPLHCTGVSLAGPQPAMSPLCPTDSKSPLPTRQGPWASRGPIAGIVRALSLPGGCTRSEYCREEGEAAAETMVMRKKMDRMKMLMKMTAISERTG